MSATTWADVLRSEADVHRAEVRRLEVRLAYHLQLRTEREPEQKTETNADRVASLGMRILHVLACSPGGLGMPMIRSMVGSPALHTHVALEQLERSGAIVRSGNGHGVTYFAVPAEREPGSD